MEETKLQYLGKKAPFKVPPIIKGDYTFGKEPVWVPAGVAEKLMEINPCMFAKVGERNGEDDFFEDAGSIQPKEDLETPDIPDDLICGKCGKAYSGSGRGPNFYAKHIEKCTGDDK